MPSLPSEGLEDDATQAGAHDPSASTASATDAMQVYIAPAAATPIVAPVPVKPENQAEISDASPGEPVIGDPDLDDDAGRCVELAKMAVSDVHGIFHMTFRHSLC